MTDGADAKAKFAETLMKFGVSLQQFISTLGSKVACLCTSVPLSIMPSKVIYGNFYSQRSVIFLDGLKGPK